MELAANIVFNLQCLQVLLGDRISNQITLDGGLLHNVSIDTQYKKT